MAKLFDEVLADNLQRKSVLLSCGVWGSFPGSDFPALHTPLMIRIKDVLTFANTANTRAESLCFFEDVSMDRF